MKAIMKIRAFVVSISKQSRHPSCGEYFLWLQNLSYEESASFATGLEPTTT